MIKKHARFLERIIIIYWSILVIIFFEFLRVDDKKEWRRDSNLTD